jgi:Predicted transcriptional regulator
MSDTNNNDDFIKSIIAGQSAQRAMTVEEIGKMYDELKARFGSGSSSASSSADVSASEHDGSFVLTDDLRKLAKKSITETHVKCMECGMVKTVISKKHLESHGLTLEEYLTKWGFPPKTKLTSKGYQKARSERMKEMRLWERRGNAKNSEVAPETVKPEDTKKVTDKTDKAKDKDKSKDEKKEPITNGATS